MNHPGWPVALGGHVFALTLAQPTGPGAIVADVPGPSKQVVARAIWLPLAGVPG